MPIVNLQVRAMELGRIRMGDKGDKGQPRKLSTFRLTSQNRALLNAAAERYGGEVTPWKENPGHFELYTTAQEIPFMAAPMEISQWYEHWSGGGCLRRCDGETEINTDRACVCDPDSRECKMTTRFSVMLHELPGVGVWRLETHGFYAATELPAQAGLLIRLAWKGRFVPATLAIESREIKRPNEPLKKFIVPVIRTPFSFAELLEAHAQALDITGASQPSTLEAPALRQIAAAPTAPARQMPAQVGGRDSTQRRVAAPVSEGRDAASTRSTPSTASTRSTRQTARCSSSQQENENRQPPSDPDDLSLDDPPTSTDAATPAQLEAIAKLCVRHSIAVQQFVQSEAGVEIAALTVDQASGLIKKLNAPRAA